MQLSISSTTDYCMDFFRIIPFIVGQFHSCRSILFYPLNLCISNWIKNMYTRAEGTRFLCQNLPGNVIIPIPIFLFPDVLIKLYTSSFFFFLFLSQSLWVSRICLKIYLLWLAKGFMGTSSALHSFKTQFLSIFLSIQLNSAPKVNRNWMNTYVVHNSNFLEISVL